jgi:hypothetical protein
MSSSVMLRVQGCFGDRIQSIKGEFIGGWTGVNVPVGLGIQNLLSVLD